MTLVEIASIGVVGSGFLILAAVLFYQQIRHFKHVKDQIQQEKDKAILEPAGKSASVEAVTEDTAAAVMKALITMQGAASVKGRAAG